VRRRLGWWVLVVCLAAGCTPATPTAPPVDDRADVWFLQHMVPYLRQTMVAASLARERLGDPRLARLAGAITRRSQADVDQLQGWLDQRGLSAHGHSHQRVDASRRTDLERLARLRGPALDRAFVEIMTARARTGSGLAAEEARAGALPEVRRFARRLAADQQRQLHQLQSDATTRGARGPPGCGGHRVGTWPQVRLAAAPVMAAAWSEARKAAAWPTSARVVRRSSWVLPRCQASSSSRVMPSGDPVP
jgi:uncharacterized protein (DUF305 family)